MQTTDKLVRFSIEEDYVSTTGFRFTDWLGEGLRQLLLFPLLRVITPMRVAGLENLQGSGPYIFAVNHNSHLDAAVLLAALPRRLRLRVRVAAAADYFFANRWIGMFVSILLNAFTFERKSVRSVATSLLQARRYLTSGYSLLLFPEGTRSRDGHLQPFKRGVGKLALAGAVQVIPTWIDGTYAAMPRGTDWPRMHPVTVCFGALLQFAAGSNAAAVTAAIEQQIRVLATRTALAKSHR